MSVTFTIWKAADKPVKEGDLEGTCRTCGRESIGLLFTEWVRKTFMDFDKLVPGMLICHACQFAFAERSERLAQIVGKEKPQRMRNYSHFVVDDSWIPLSKGDKLAMQAILLDKKWSIAVIAQSGQKHILFRATPGILQFEEQRITTLDKLPWLLQTVEHLYRGGFSKTEIETGQYAQHRVMKFGIPNWTKAETELRPYRQTAQFSLVVFLAQKENIKNDRDARDGRNAAGCDMENDTEQLQEPVSPHDLAAVRGQHQVSGLHEQPGQIRQQALPGIER